MFSLGLVGSGSSHFFIRIRIRIRHTDRGDSVFTWIQEYSYNPGVKRHLRIKKVTKKVHDSGGPVGGRHVERQGRHRVGGHRQLQGQN